MSAIFKPSQVLPAIQAINFNDISVSPEDFAVLFSRYVHFGSKKNVLSLDDIEVYANHDAEFPGKEDKKVQDFDGVKVPTTLTGLLATGTKFLDAVVWLALDENKRPKPRVVDSVYDPAKGRQWATYGDHSKIARCMFFYFFYILTRARPPTADEMDINQPIPNFLKNVLGFSETPGSVAEYLASFPLSRINPAWVKHINLQGLSMEALNRFGLGVAGYRMAAPFKLYSPFYETIEGKAFFEKNKGAIETGEIEWGAKYEEAIEVAKAIAMQPADWDVHPSTRAPDLLTKYGNLNKNLGNLILKVFSDEQIDEMVKTKILYSKPNFERAHLNFTTWKSADKFVGTKKIFNAM